MFESSEDSCKALTELISIYEDYLTMVHDEPAIPDLDIQDTHIVGGEAIEVIELDGRTMIVEEINLAAHVPTMDESVVWIPGPRTNVAQQLRRMVAEQGRYYGMNNEVDDEDDFDFEDDY